nr:ParA family protein [Planctomycetota bacterium]
ALEAYEKGCEEPPQVVLFDCPPSLGMLSLNALVASRHVVIPLQAEFFALQGMAQLLDVIERVKRRLNPGLDLLGLLVGMFQKQRNLSREVLQELHNHFGALVFPTLVRVNVRLAEAPSHGLTIYEYAPECGGAADFAAVAAELARRLGLAAAPPPAASREEPPPTALTTGTEAAAAEPMREWEAG